MQSNEFHKLWWPLRAARSDEGFVVKFKGLRYGIEYAEGQQIFRLEVERGTGKPDWIVYAKSVKRQREDGQMESVSEEARERICARVRAALSYLKMSFVMD